MAINFKETKIVKKVEEIKENHPTACTAIKIVHTAATVVVNAVVMYAVGSDAYEMIKEHSKVIEEAKEVVEAIE